MSDFPMKLNCGLSLRPLEWSQRVQRLLDSEGRRLSATCEVASSDLELSEGLRMGKLSAEVQILERTQIDLSIFPERTIGWLSFRPAQESEHVAFLTGEFFLNAQSLEEVWQQVRQGGYSACLIRVYFGLDRVIRIDGINWLWDVTKHPHLLIQEVSVLFNRNA
jgi:hypothetical protein